MNIEREVANEQISLLKTVNELHKNNKLTKVNAWNYDYIDSFESLVRNHHRYIKNFQNVCPSMDTMARIYELRVDSVSTDVLRIANKIPCSLDDSGNELNESNESHVSMRQEVSMQRNKRDQKQRRKSKNNLRSNIATKAQLNAPLQLLSSLPDPILLKKQKIDGEEGKPNRMLLNLFPTVGTSNVSICDNQRFFDKSRTERVKFENNNDYDVPIDSFSEIPIKVYREFTLIRPTEFGYLLKETLDVDENEYCESIGSLDVNQSDSFIFDFDDMEQGEFHYDFATPNTNSQCEPLVYDNELNHENEADAALDDENLEPPNDIQPLHPPLDDLSKGDYSYFKDVENFSLGPSYWRFKNKRKHSYSNCNEPTPKPAKVRRKKRHEMPSFTTSEDSGDDEFIETQKVREVNCARWDSQKNLLPMYRTTAIKPIPKDFFDFYEFAPKLRTWNDKSRGNDSLNYTNSPLNSSEDEAQILDDIPPLTISPNTNQFDEMPECVNDVDDRMNVEAPEWQVPEDISQLYTGAPYEVKQINIKFDKLPKRINMKKVNTATLVSVKKQFERSIELPVNIRPNEKFEKGYATFENTHRSLVKRFKDIASPPISLLSILHNTNDHRFKLDRKPNEISNNFKIQQLKEHSSRPSFDLNGNIVDVERTN